MILLTALILLIAFLAFFIYFSGLNPQDVTIFLSKDMSFTMSRAVLVVASIVTGLVLGIVVHFYYSMIHQLRHWKSNRKDKKSTEISSTYREGVARLLSGDIKKAHSLLQKALDRDASRLEIYLALVSVHLQEGNPQQAVALLQKAKSLDPSSLEVLFKLAGTYEEMDRNVEAGEVYEEILGIESNNRKALRGYRDIYIKQKKWQQALELQKRLIKAAQGTTRFEAEKEILRCLHYEVAGQTLAEGQIDKAKSELKDIIKAAPKFVPARVTLGDAMQAQGQVEDAAKTWQDGYKALGKIVFLARLENLYLGEEDPATLLSFYRTSIKEKGDDLLLRLFYGKLCLRLEMVDEALEQLYAVENAGADFPQLHLLLAEAHRRRNRTEESIEEYKRALGVNLQLQLGYICDVCGEDSEEWKSRCESCGTWGSFSLAGRDLIQGLKPSEARAFHHGERS